jgi:hypothetical protein
MDGACTGTDGELSAIRRQRDGRRAAQLHRRFGEQIASGGIPHTREPVTDAEQHFAVRAEGNATDIFAMTQRRHAGHARLKVP